MVGDHPALTLGGGVVPPRPRSARGRFLRIVTLNDVYKLDHHPSVKTCIDLQKAAAAELDCEVISTLNGDFLSPSVLTSLDRGETMLRACNKVGFDYYCLGNHEFDLSKSRLQKLMSKLTGTLVNSNVNDEELAGFPKSVVLPVGDRHVLLGGFCTENPSIYPPSTRPMADPITQSAIDTWGQACGDRQAGGLPPLDCFVMMTHQLIAEDRATGIALLNYAPLAGKVPVLLAGHDHEVYIEEAGQSMVVKVGEDAQRIGIVDIWWRDDGSLGTTVVLLPSDEFDRDPTVAQFVKEKHDFLDRMMSAPIATMPAPMSSERVRFEPSGVATFLLDLVKGGLNAQGVELAMIQGGAIRANTAYPAGPFRMGALFSELAFECMQAVIVVPGHVIEDSIKNSRDLPKPAPNYLHCDSGVELSPDTWDVLRVNGSAFSRDRRYKLAIYQFLLSGLNAIEPLLSYARANLDVPTAEACQPVKEIVLDECLARIWLRLLDVPPEARKAPNSHELVMQAGRLFFERWDFTRKGYIELHEMQGFTELWEANDVSPLLASRLVHLIDHHGKNMIEVEDFAVLPHTSICSS